MLDLIRTLTLNLVWRVLGLSQGNAPKKCTCTLRNTQTEEEQRKNLAKKQHFQPSHGNIRQIFQHKRAVSSQMVSRPKSLKFGNLQI